MQLSSLFYSSFLLQICISLDPPVLELHRDNNDHLKSPPSFAASPRRSRRDAGPSSLFCGKGGRSPPCPAPAPRPPCTQNWVFSSTLGQEKTFKGQRERCPLLPLCPRAGAAAHPQQREAPVMQGVLGRENCAEISVLV